VGTYLDGLSLNNKPRGRRLVIVKERRAFRSAASTSVTAEGRRALGVARVITANTKGMRALEVAGLIQASTRGHVVLDKERMTPAEATRTRVVMEVDDSHDSIVRVLETHCDRLRRRRLMQCSADEWK
jgi:hypothetical protein